MLFPTNLNHDEVGLIPKKIAQNKQFVRCIICSLLVGEVLGTFLAWPHIGNATFIVGSCGFVMGAGMVYAIYQNAVAARARLFNGHRSLLENLVLQGKEDRAVLDKHEEIMLQENRQLIKGFVFEAEKDNHKVMLVGTIHFLISKGNQQQYFYPNIIKDAIENGTLYVECDITNPERILEAQNILKRLGIRIEVEDLENDYSMNRGGYDKVLIDVSHSVGKFPQELETLESNFKFLPKVVQITKDIFKIIDAVQWGCEKCMCHPPNGFSNFDPDRDINFADQIESAINEKEKAVFAIGSLHFFHYRNVRVLLEERGIKVTRVKII